MRLKISKCKNVNIYYVIKTIYIDGKEMKDQYGTGVTYDFEKVSYK